MHLTREEAAAAAAVGVPPGEVYLRYGCRQRERHRRHRAWVGDNQLARRGADVATVVDRERSDEKPR